MSDTIWKIIFRTLKEHGIDVYAPSDHMGECVKPYTVVKSNGVMSAVGVSSNIALYYVMLYVPAKQYFFLEEYKREVKDVIDQYLFPLLRDQHSETADFYDDNVKAYMVSMTYANYRKNTR